jgi:hypothetical protein
MMICSNGPSLHQKEEVEKFLLAVGGPGYSHPHPHPQEFRLKVKGVRDNNTSFTENMWRRVHIYSKQKQRTMWTLSATAQRGVGWGREGGRRVLILQVSIYMTRIAYYVHSRVNN